MKAVASFLLTIVLLVGFPKIPAIAQPAGTDRTAVESVERKLTYLQHNGELAHPNPAPTQLTESEINAYLNSGAVRLPAGVQSLQLQGESGVVTANSRIDFDQVKAGQHSSNPLLSVFSGLHDVVVVAHAHGADHEGMVHVDSVSLDGVEIPSFVLQLFLEKYIQPRYPNLGIDSRFALPDRIDTATIGRHEVILTQK